jgi:hypothetical protein
METGESRTSNVTEKRTEIFYPEMMPETWKNQYKGLRVGRTSDDPDKEILYAVYGGYQGGGEKIVPVSMDKLVRAIEEGPGGFKSRKMTKEEYDKDPQLGEALIENERLHRKLQVTMAQNEEYQQQIGRLEGELTSVNNRLNALENRIGVVSSIPINEPQAVDAGTTVHPRAPFVNTDIVEPEPGIIANGTTTGTDEPRPVLTDVNVDNNAGAEPQQSGGFKSRWNRTKGSIGGAVLGWQVRAHNGAYKIIDKQGRDRYVVGNDEIIDAHTESERRVGGAILLGGVAVVGAGILGWWLGKHYGHDHINNFSEIISQNNTIKGQNNRLLSEVESMKGQINTDSTLLGRMSDRINQLKNQLDANNRLLRSDHNLLLNLKHQEAGEAARNVSLSSEAHTEALRYRGDTIWTHAQNLIERRTERAPSTERIRRVTARILDINGLRWNSGGPGVDAHKLPRGFNFKVPNKIT